MGKKRIYELAKEMNKASKDVVDKAHQLGMDVKNHMGAISSEQETTDLRIGIFLFFIFSPSKNVILVQVILL